MKYKIFYQTIAMVLIAVGISGCNNQVTFDQIDRSQIPLDFHLTRVNSKNGELIEQFNFNNQNQLSSVVLNGSDRFNLSYESNKLIAFNDYKCTYDQESRLIEVHGPELSNSKLTYGPKGIQIIQTTRPIVPGSKAVQVDTLNLFLNDQGLVVRATLFPKKLGFEIRYDQFSNPYVNIQDNLLPLLLVYPVEEIFGDIASLVSKRNITRIYQNAINISSNIE